MLYHLMITIFLLYMQTKFHERWYKEMLNYVASSHETKSTHTLKRFDGRLWRKMKSREKIKRQWTINQIDRLKGITLQNGHYITQNRNGFLIFTWRGTNRSKKVWFHSGFARVLRIWIGPSGMRKTC